MSGASWGANGWPLAGRRRLAGLAAMVLAGFGGVYAAAGRQDWSGADAARARHEVAAAEQARVERVLRNRPIEGEEAVAAASSMSGGAVVTGRDPAWQLAVAAHDHGLHLRRLAPAPAEGGGGKAGEVSAVQFDVAGDGRLASIAAWIRSLARLPIGVVPLRVDIRRRDVGASFSVRVAVSPVPSVSQADREREDGAAPAASDPLLAGAAEADFGGHEIAVPPRLAGIVGDARRGLALFDTGVGPWCATVGEQVGTERVERIDGGGVWLGAADGRRRRVALMAGGER